MDYAALMEELKMRDKVIAITRVKREGESEPVREGCALAALKRALNGGTLIITENNLKCSGGCTGFGLTDGIPDTPGGFGYFIAQGRGEGFPHGERIKKTPEMGEEMLLRQPQDVMGGCNAIEVRPYSEECEPELVAALVNPDQLSALIHLFNYEKTEYDNVIAPMTSGCASVFRIPFGKLAKGENARAVIGNVDVFSRPHFPADTFFFTVSGRAFARMIEIAGESMLLSPIWRGVKRRLTQGN